MNPKEIKEIRGRFRADHNSITSIFGCYVNTEGNIIAHINESIGSLTEEEAEHYFGLLRKMFAGKLGKDLLNLEFTGEQEQGEEYKKLLAVVQGKFDSDTRKRLFDRIIASLSAEENYVILAAEDTYDVPKKQADGETTFEGREVFRYFSCIICPVKHGKLELGFEDAEKRFHSARIRQMIAQPVLGFMFPAFTDRSTDIHHAVIYSKGEQENYEPFITAVFGEFEKVPLTGDEQKARFNFALEDNLDDECTFETIQRMHQTLADRVSLHKESKVPEPLKLMPGEIGEILAEAGSSKAAVSAFEEKIQPLCDKEKEEPGIQVSNITDEKRMTIETSGVRIAVKPSAIKAVRTEKQNGRSVIMFNVNDFCSINGVNVQID